MIRTGLSLLFISFLSQFKAQKEYFQQQVDFEIDVALDDKNHLLRGFEKFTYQNKSEDTLNFIYIHLWPNAYQSTHSALGKQMLEEGNTNLHFSYEKDKGLINAR